jgi:hypothetical protein
MWFKPLVGFWGFTDVSLRYSQHHALRATLWLAASETSER